MYLSIISLFMICQHFLLKLYLNLNFHILFSFIANTFDCMKKRRILVDSLHIIQGYSWRTTCRKPNVYITLNSPINWNNLDRPEKVFAINKLIQIKPTLKNCTFLITHITKKNRPAAGKTFFYLIQTKYYFFFQMLPSP